MVGCPMRDLWVNGGNFAMNPPAQLLDESSQWIPSTVGPVANTIESLRPACEGNRHKRRNGPDSNDTNKTRGVKRKRQGKDGTIPPERVPPARSARHLALVPEFGNTRQRSMFQPRNLYPAQPRPNRVANLTATSNDLLYSPRYYRPPPTGSQPSLPRPLNTSTQRGNAMVLQHPMSFAPPYGIGDRLAPRVGHTTTVHPTLPVRRAPIVGSTTAARQPTATYDPLSAYGGGHQVHNRIAARQYPPSAAPVTFCDHRTRTPIDVTTRVFEYPSPPRQTSYFTAGDEFIYQRNGQVRVFPGPYFISREQAYKIGRGHFFPAHPSCPETAAIDQTREYNNNNRWEAAYIDPATDIFAGCFPCDDEVVLTAEPNHERASFHISCEHCGSQGHITIECPLVAWGSVARN